VTRRQGRRQSAPVAPPLPRASSPTSPASHGSGLALDLPEPTGWFDRRRWLGPTALPLVVSLAVHSVLLILIAGLAWQVTLAPRPDRTIPVQLSLSPEPSDTPQAPDESAPVPALSAIASGEGLEGSAISTPDAGTQGQQPEISHRVLGRSGTGESGTMKALGGGKSSAMGGVMFAGVRARQAKEIVYVVDASGAMVSSFTWVVQELTRSIETLDPEQSFQVVLFRDRPPARGLPAALVDQFPGGTGRLIAATPANKMAMTEWLRRQHPLGRSNPMDGLLKGLEYTPDVIFLLSRSIRRSGGAGGTMPAWGLGREATLARLEQANPREAWSGKREVVIKALQFIEDDPTGTMRAIAGQHGDGEGSYRIVKPLETPSR
jgi:hypothetical protein